MPSMICAAGASSKSFLLRHGYRYQGKANWSQPTCATCANWSCPIRP